MGVPNSSFYPQFVLSGQKNLIFSEIFPFLGNKCTFGATKLQFLSQSGQKNLIFTEIFPFLGKNVHLGVPNSSFYPQFVRLGKRNLIFSEMFPFFRESMDIWGYQTPVFILIGSKKTSFLVKFFPF